MTEAVWVIQKKSADSPVIELLTFAENGEPKWATEHDVACVFANKEDALRVWCSLFADGFGKQHECVVRQCEPFNMDDICKKKPGKKK